MLLALFQCIFVTGAGACLYKTVRHFADQKIAWIAYGFYFILGGLSAWIMIPYSDSTGIIFLIFLFYLSVKIKETESVKKRCMLLFLLFFFCYIGFEIKPMAAIVDCDRCSGRNSFCWQAVEKQSVWKNRCWHIVWQQCLAWERQLGEFLQLLVPCISRLLRIPCLAGSIT